MSELTADRTDSLPSIVRFAPPDIARRRVATWNGIQTRAVPSGLRGAVPSALQQRLAVVPVRTSSCGPTTPTSEGPILFTAGSVA
jgi:hypothetical protein